VEDNGPGLPPDQLEQVFDPFFTTKEPGKGTGLGLALSAQLVEGMGGEITGGNREEGGAVFTLRLPEAKVREEGDDDMEAQNGAAENQAESGGEA
jgi:C4-dicarboxylate-specific signal transduction histidine kinase